jgi:hypothetical protein
LWPDRYEAVRRQALDGDTGAGWGLALVERQGLVAWMRAWPPDTSPSPLPVLAQESDRSCSLPSDLCGQIASVMADMILSHRQQEIPV